MVLELKEIPTNQIVANPEQPRETFEREKLVELSDSIKEIGLINPITVRKKGKQFEIVAGERRWRAHQIGKIGKVPAIVKEYKNEGQVAVESLIENVHREDLSIQEKGKFLIRIKKLENIPNNNQLAKKVGLSFSNVSDAISSVELGENVSGPLTSTQVSETKSLGPKDRIKVIKKAQAEGIGNRNLRALAKVVKNSSEEVKEAVLNNKITTDQAENLTKISSPKAREKALEETSQHNKVANITPKLAEKAKPELTTALKKSFNSYQKVIFKNLYDAKVSLIKANRFLPKANKMLNQLMQIQFEYGDEKILKTTMTQMKSIFDEINKFDIHTTSFEELKEQFVERIENKDDGC